MNKLPCKARNLPMSKFKRVVRELLLANPLYTVHKFFVLPDKYVLFVGSQEGLKAQQFRAITKASILNKKMDFTSCENTSKLRKGMIIGMGNSMLDLIGHVDNGVLEKYKLIANNGYLARKEHMGLFQELIEECNAKYVVGGSVQNTFRVVQWVLGDPEVCIIFGGIGCDKEGEELVEKARADGVDTQYQYIEKVPTGICAVLLTENGAERTLVANLSAAKCFTLDHLMREENQKRLLNADIFYISGFFLAVSIDAVMYAAKMASERKKWYIMNLSATYLAEQYMDGWNQVMPYVDILFGNETEARSFAKESQFEEINDVSQIAVKLSSLPKHRLSQSRVVVITQGSDPVIVVTDGCIKQYPTISLSPEQVVDTTGAGDAFVGGFLAQFVRGLALEECVHCGVWCAAEMVQQRGCSLEGLKKYSNSPRSHSQY